MDPLRAEGRAALWISSGVIVWALHFTAIYGVTALACARGFALVIPWSIASATLVAAALSVTLIVKGYRARATFIGWMTASVAALGLIAIAYEFIAAVLSPTCA